MDVEPTPTRADGDPPEELVGAGFEELLDEVLHRVRAARDEQVRWRLLLDAVVTMAADLSLDDLLARIVRIAGDLVGARYAALGVLSTSGQQRLRMFLTQGVGPEEAAAIGDLPSGHGLLGLIIDRPEPLRLHDIAEHPESFGFPANHPPMRSFLGVPIRTRDKVFGNLYLSEKESGGDFTAEDEGIVVALAAAAGVAIENARLYEEADRRQRWLAATAQITTTLLGEVTGDEGLQLVADLAREVAGADLAWILTGPDAERLRLRVVSGLEIDPDEIESATLESSSAGTAVRTGAPLTVEDLGAEPQATDFGVLPLRELGPAMMFPLRDVDPTGRIGTEGVLTLAWTRAHADAADQVDVALPAAFAEQAALALRMARGTVEGRRLAVYEDRDRIGRDLHDVVIQRLFAIGLNLQGALRRAGDGPLATRLDEAIVEIDDTIRDIRRTIFELGAMDRSGDVQTEVTQLVERAASALKFRPTLAFEGAVRLRVGPAIVPDLVAVLAEALSNTTRHAGATQVSVLVRVADDAATLRVADDGTGIPDDVAESGLANMRDRAAAHGGACVVRAGETGGTVVEWTVPLS